MNTVCMLTLLTALHAVESSSGRDPNCAGNEYQITRTCVDDVNRILREKNSFWQYTYADVLKPWKDRGIALVYMNHYGEKYRRKTGTAPTTKVYALIFHLGYHGYFDAKNAAEAKRYWGKVRQHLEGNAQ